MTRPAPNAAMAAVNHEPIPQSSFSPSTPSILILWSLLISWFIWEETMNLKGFIGLGFIVFAGIYTFIREKKKQVKITLDKPLR